MAAPKPTVWTAGHFKSETNPRRKRKKLLGIDTQLERFDIMKNVGDHHAIIKQLAKVLAECDAYLTNQLQRKRDKEQWAQSGRFRKGPSEILLNRINKVETLRKQTWNRIAWESFERHKGMRPTAAARATAQTLGAGYRSERSDFTTQKAAQNLGGTTTHLNAAGGSFVHDAIDNHAGWQPNFPANIQTILAKNFSVLTQQEFRAVVEYFDGGGGVHASGHETHVHFVRKDERLNEYLVMVDDNGHLIQRGALLDFKTFGMWAMDEYGNLIVNPRPAVLYSGPAGQAQFNHSSLNAGNDVVCAGMMKCSNGIITLISNESGHYQPTATQLANALAVLAEDGADLSQLATIELMPNRDTFNTLAAFLALHPAE
jgi:hypothetical protein